MSGFDFIIVGIFAISVVVGVMRGFIREALSITSWIMAIWLGLTFCEPAGDYLSQYVSIPADAFRTAAGFGLVFVGTLFLFSIISFIVTKLLVRDAIKGTDRALGLGFGAVRAMAIVVVVLLIARGMGLENSGWWQSSRYLAYFVPTANYIEQLLPEQLQSKEKPQLEAPPADQEPFNAAPASAELDNLAEPANTVSDNTIN